MNPRTSAFGSPAKTFSGRISQNTLREALHAWPAESLPGHLPIPSLTFFASNTRIRRR